MPKAVNGDVHYSFDDIKNNVDKIVQQMAHRRVMTSIDTIVALGTGGWIPGKLLKNRLSIEGIQIPAYSLGVVNYDADRRMLPFPTIYQPLPSDLTLENKTVLLVDEVADSGRSLVKAREFVMDRKPKKLYIAVLHKKPHSQFEPDFVGEYFDVKKTGSQEAAWIIYPWE